MARQAEYPPGHKFGMRVPHGGSSCAKCEYVTKDKRHCSNKYFIQWNGASFLPAPAEDYCCDVFQAESHPLRKIAEKGGAH